ncbi:MAG: hypothetical protein V1736_03240 [Pseudomonadota bacterium]
MPKPRVLIISIHILFISLLLVACGSGGGDEGGTVNSEPGDPVPSPLVEVKTIHRAVDPYNNIVLLGEVRNAGDAAGSFIKVEFVFYDVSSNVLGIKSTYIVGNCLTLAVFGTQTDTCLKPGQTGYYIMRTNINNSLVSTYTCTTSFRDLETEDPGASLIVTGETNVKEDEFGYLELAGAVKNEGILTLALGVVTVITKDKNGNVVNVAYDYITGDTVYVPEMEKNTDTGLRPGSTGTFCVDLGALPSNDLEHIFKTSWIESYGYRFASRIRPVCRDRSERDEYIRRLDLSISP